ncbi:hypothetical protein HQ545_02030 [Candidatus Woesearchaeota archaeon]|nr:hypothetical protein [Candidatus Woesearchaeota archaeon]
MGAPKRPFEIGKQYVVRSFSLNFKHVFSLEYLYKKLHEWLIEEGYTKDGTGDGDDSWMEQLYLERVGGDGSKQIWIRWRTSKNYANSFFKLYLDIDYHILGMKKHEIVAKGTKVGTNKGEVEVFVTAKMAIDPDKTWDKSFIMKNKRLQYVYLNRIYKQRIEEVENELVRDSARLLGAIKQYFQLESWLPEYAGQSFHPEKGE